MREPGRTAGAQETALQPIACPLKMAASQDPSSIAVLEPETGQNTDTRTFECQNRQLPV